MESLNKSGRRCRWTLHQVNRHRHRLQLREYRAFNEDAAWIVHTVDQRADVKYFDA
jgi:hypothetical protein